MLKIQNIYKSFNSKVVLNGVSLSLPKSSIAGLIGPSGGGKSVLFKIMAGIHSADKGEVIYQPERKTGMSLMFQEGALFDSLTVFDNVAFPLVNGKVPVAALPKRIRENVTEQVMEILGKVGLSKAIAKFPGQLSGGMRRRASLARALVDKPEMTLLDDPTFGLDPVASSTIMQLIVDLHKEYGSTVLIISHDLRRLLPIVDNVFALFHGKIEFDGKVEEISKNASDEIKYFVQCRYDLEDNTAGNYIVR